MLTQSEFAAIINLRRRRWRTSWLSAAGLLLAGGAVLVVWLLTQPDGSGLSTITALTLPTAVPATILAGVLFAVLWTRSLRPRCPKCLHRLYTDHEEVAATGACPNCHAVVISDGVAVQASQQVAAIASLAETTTAADEPVAGDTYFCRTCGYQLAGLRPSSQCPECGTLVRESLAAVLLAQADPHWRQTVTHGLNWMARSVWTGLGLWALGAFTWNVLGYSIPRGANVTVAAAIFSLGLWLVTAQDPRDQSSESAWSWRAIARLGWIPGMAGLLLAALLNQSPVAGGNGPEAWGTRILVLGSCFAVGLGLTRWIEQLALRAPDVQLAFRASRCHKSLRVGVPAIVGCALLNEAVRAWLPSLVGVGRTAVFVSVIYGIFLSFRFGALLFRARRQLTPVLSTKAAP